MHGSYRYISYPSNPHFLIFRAFQANRTCPICRADASEVQRDSEWPHVNTHNPWLPFGCTNQSVNFSPFIIHRRSHILPHNWDQCSVFLPSLSPGTLNSNSHLGSATFYWLTLTLSLDFLGLLVFGLLHPYYSAFCSWLPLTMNGLWNAYTQRHVQVDIYMCIF